jgi:hypothetical protein
MLGRGDSSNCGPSPKKGKGTKIMSAARHKILLLKEKPNFVYSAVGLEI